MHGYESFMENTKSSTVLTWQRKIKWEGKRNLRESPMGVK